MVDVFNPNGYGALGAMMRGQTVIRNATPVGASANYGISGKVSSALSSIKQSASSKAASVVSGIKSGNPVKSSGRSVYVDPYDYSGSGSGAGASTAKELDYYAADLSKRYGMNKETAYAEAMENTSYQRAVKDMQSAGLNPAVLFANGRVSGAGNGQVFMDRSGSRGGSGGGSGRRRSGSSSGSNRLSGGIYYGVTAAAQVIGAAVGGIRAGYIAGNVAQNVMKSINGFRK